MSNQRRRAFTTVRRRLLGVAMLMTIALFLSGTVAVYNRAFVPSVDVDLHAVSSGNQLLPDSDVKVHGMVVGRVEQIESADHGATLSLSLQPDKAQQLPANVTAKLLPRTLFGERYVSLEIPQSSTDATLSSGDVIQQDRSPGAVELEKVLADTMPVLRAVQPDELAVTLNSLSTALEGRGRPLGETITQLNTYLDGLNPALPDLRENLKQLVGVAETYEEAAPNVAEALKNLSTTSRTLAEQRGNLNTMTSQLTTTSNDLTGFLEANSENIIRLGESSRPTLDVMRKYSPSFPCFLDAMNKLKPRIDEAFGKGTDEPGLHVTLEVVSHRGKYEPNQDEPEYNDKRGPRCYEYEDGPDPFPQYPPDGPIQDGSKPPPPARTQDDGLQPPGMEDRPASTSPQSAAPGLGVANSPAERDLVSSVVAPSMGMAAGDVPDWGSVLLGPVFRGAEVSYR